MPTEIRNLPVTREQIERELNGSTRSKPSCSCVGPSLTFFAGGHLIGHVLANRYREDLERAGLGSGRHGFVFSPPPGLAFAPNAVEVRRSLDGTLLAFAQSIGAEEVHLWGRDHNPTAGYRVFRKCKN